MTFILTTQKEDVVKENFKNISSNYKFLDLDLLKAEFYDMNIETSEEFNDILLNQFIMKKIKNGIKNFKNTHFFYRIDKININVVNNIKKFISKNHSHKINKFVVFENETNVKKYYFYMFDEVYEIN